MRRQVRRVARRAEAATPLRVLARGGFAANGIVHAITGVLVLVVAFGGHAESDQAGAFKALAGAPLGFVVLWTLAAALWALALWHTLDGLLAPRGDALKKWGIRASEWSQAIVFAAVGVFAAAVAMGARPNADRTAEQLSRGVLFVPGGPLVLGGVGAGIGITGIAFVVMGIRRSFTNKLRTPSSPRVGRVISLLGAIGFIGKGVALLILAVLLMVAAVRVDPTAAGGLDAAIAALVAMPWGVAVTFAIGAGLIVYGVFCLFRAKYADLDG